MVTHFISETNFKTRSKVQLQCLTLLSSYVCLENINFPYIPVSMFYITYYRYQHIIYYPVK